MPGGAALADGWLPGGDLCALGLLVLAGVFFFSRAVRRDIAERQKEGVFIANVSHELKTPVTKIQFFNELLQQLPETAEEKRRCYHRAIGQECERLLMLVENVLDFGEIENGGRAYAPIRVPVSEVLDATVRTFKALCGDRAYGLKVEVHDDDLHVRADPKALHQALVNLLDNALKYSDPHTLLIHVRKDALLDVPAVAITIEDRGIGIPKEKIDLIFGEFYRVDSGLTQRVSGSGLGLALVQHVVDAHGGAIRVESEEGIGSRFTLLLPLTTASTAPGTS